MLSAMTLEDDVPQYKTYMAGFAARAIAKVHVYIIAWCQAAPLKLHTL